MPSLGQQILTIMVNLLYLRGTLADGEACEGFADLTVAARCQLQPRTARVAAFAESDASQVG